MNSIPIVDLFEFDLCEVKRAALAKSLCEICHGIGFFVVKNHRVNPQLTQRVFDHSRRFFEFPLEKKKGIDKRNSRWFRGWEGVGSEFTNNRPDYREQIDFWTEHEPLSGRITPHYLRLLGPNQWPAEDDLPGFRKDVNQLTLQMQQLATGLMQLIAVGLGLAEEYFDGVFGTQRMSLVKIIRYPRTPDGEFGVNPHHDTGFLTVLNPGLQPGLEVESSNGEWLPVPLIEGGLVINLGEMLQAMTGNYFIATPHRVAATQQRHSMGYFHGPSLDTKLQRLPLDIKFGRAVEASPRHNKAGFMAPIAETESGVAAMQGQLQATTYGEQVWNYFCRSYPDNVKKFYPELIG